MEELFSHLLNMDIVNDVRQKCILPIAPVPCSIEAEMAFVILKKYKSLCNYQIPAELMQVGGILA
jgi:hypothetical protein